MRRKRRRAPLVSKQDLEHQRFLFRARVQRSSGECEWLPEWGPQSFLPNKDIIGNSCESSWPNDFRFVFRKAVEICKERGFMVFSRSQAAVGLASLFIVFYRIFTIMLPMLKESWDKKDIGGGLQALTLLV